MIKALKGFLCKSNLDLNICNQAPTCQVRCVSTAYLKFICENQRLTERERLNQIMQFPGQLESINFWNLLIWVDDGLLGLKCNFKLLIYFYE